jgi:predicted nucleic acid-binding protein
VAALEEVGLRAGEQATIEPSGDGELRIRRATGSFDEAFGALTHARARALFTRWHQDQDAAVISAVNLTEVLIGPSADAAKLAVARRAIGALGVTVHQPTEAIAVEAARLPQRHPVSLPDGYCLATAKHIRSTIASFDQKILKAAQREGIAVL